MQAVGWLKARPMFNARNHSTKTPVSPSAGFNWELARTPTPGGRHKGHQLHAYAMGRCNSAGHLVVGQHVVQGGGALLNHAPTRSFSSTSAAAAAGYPFYVGSCFVPPFSSRFAPPRPSALLRAVESTPKKNRKKNQDCVMLGCGLIFETNG